MSGQRKPRGDQEAPEVQRIPGMGIGTRCRQLLILDDVTRGPGTDAQPDQGNRKA